MDDLDASSVEDLPEEPRHPSLKVIPNVPHGLNGLTRGVWDIPVFVAFPREGRLILPDPHGDNDISRIDHARVHGLGVRSIERDAPLGKRLDGDRADLSRRVSAS